jgi:hypothetical protein
MRGDVALQTALSKFAIRAMRWTRNWQTHRAFFLDRGDHLIVVDRRDGGESRSHLTGVAAEVYRYLDAVRTFDAVARKFPNLDKNALRTLLERWYARRWIFSRARDDRHLALLPRIYERPHDVEAVIAEVATSSGGETAAKAAPRRMQLQVLA